MFSFRFLNRNFPARFNAGLRKSSRFAAQLGCPSIARVSTPLLCVALGALPFVMGRPAHAQTFVVAPNALANTEGNVGSPTLLTNGPRAYQSQIAASQLSAFSVGTVIRGLSFRLDNATSSPGVDLTIANYSVTLSQAANNISSFSTTYDNNIRAGTAVNVYNQAITFPASSFSSGNTGTMPEAFGPTINFTSGYTYTGGDLVITIRHSGNTQGTNLPSLDGTSASGGQGFGTTITGQYTNTGTDPQNATMATFTNYAAVVRLNTVVVTTPEPGTLSLLGMGLVTGVGMIGVLKRYKQGKAK